jgi:hypothetical protein
LNDTVHSDDLGLRLHRNQWIALIVPICYIGVQLYLRAEAGPLWQWNLLDPAYFYLLDALNILSGDPPGHIYHPGVTVHTYGATTIGLASLFVEGSIVSAVLADPERYLGMLSNGVIVANAIALTILGGVGKRIFGNWLPALACQLAPFMSTIILKHAFLPKPESFLVFATCVLISLVLLASHDELEKPTKNKLAGGFGIVAGFVAATKITAVPVLILPLFILRDPKSVAVYAVFSILAFVVFIAPGIGALGAFVEWIGRVALGAGAHGSGPQTIIEWQAYIDSIFKLLKRPSLKVPLALAFISLGWAMWRRRAGRVLPANWQWVILGVSAAQLAQVVLVAKQPTAFYMIPSYMLGALSVVFSVRLIWACRPAGFNLPIDVRTVAAVLFAGFVAAQTAGVMRLVDHMSDHRLKAGAVDNKAFANCARVYTYSASAPVYAMYLANKVTGGRFGSLLEKQFSSNDYWIDDWWQWEPVTFRNWQGAQDFAAVRAQYPCLFMRGNRPGGLQSFMKTHAPNEAFDTTCSTVAETIVTQGVDCHGNPLGRNN